MKTERCTEPTAHGRHEWYWKNILRRDCPGLTVAFCGKDETHPPHLNPVSDDLCRGLGLAGICEHGVQMLNGCDDCEAAR